jgi:hypothetical protein
MIMFMLLNDFCILLIVVQPCKDFMEGEWMMMMMTHFGMLRCTGISTELLLLNEGIDITWL